MQADQLRTIHSRGRDVCGVYSLRCVRQRSSGAMAVRILLHLLADLCHSADTVESPADDALDTRALQLGLGELALAVRNAGMRSLASVILRISERFEPILRAGDVGPRDAALLRQCLLSCLCHLAEPTAALSPAQLIDLIDRGRNHGMSYAERAHLWNELTEEAAWAGAVGPDVTGGERDSQIICGNETGVRGA